MTRPQIIAGPDDGSDPDLDPDDELDEQPEPTQQPTKAQRRRGPEPEPDRDGPTYDELMEEVVGLRERNRRNNGELAKRRQVQQFMEAHGITDLDSWLSELGVDRESGQRLPAPAPAAQPTQNDAEIERRVALATEQHQAQLQEREGAWGEERSRLQQFAISQAIEPALTRAGFSGGDVGRALKVMDLGSIQVDADEDGLLKVTGLDEAIASLKADIPEWFRKSNGVRPPRSGGGDVDGAPKPPPRPRTPTWEERVDQQLRGSSSR